MYIYTNIGEYIIVYVQITRFKNINSFLIIPFSYSRISKQILNSKALPPRIEEEKRLQSLIDKTLSDYKYLLNIISKYIRQSNIFGSTILKIKDYTEYRPYLVNI